MAPAAMAAEPASMTASIEASVGTAHPRAGTLPHGGLHCHAGCHSELGPEQLGPCGVLLLGGGVVTGQSIQPDEQCLVVLVERAHRRSSYGEAPRPVERTSSHQAKCCLVQDRLRGGSESSPLGEQPRLEGRCTTDGAAFQQLGVQAGHLDRGVPGIAEEGGGVDDGILRESKDDRVAVDRCAVAQATTNLGEAPAKRAQWVVRLGEQQPGELATGRSPLGKQEVGQQRPALAASRPTVRSIRPLDAGSPEEPDGQALCHPLRVAQNHVSPAVQRLGVGSGSRLVGRGHRGIPQECSLTL